MNNQEPRSAMPGSTDPIAENTKSTGNIGSSQIPSVGQGNTSVFQQSAGSPLPESTAKSAQQAAGQMPDTPRKASVGRDGLKLSQKKIVFLLILAFLVVGAVSTYIVVQNTAPLVQQEQPEQLADVSGGSCNVHKLRCSWSFSEELPEGVTKVAYEYAIEGPCSDSPTSSCKGITSDTSVEFEGPSDGTYTCVVSPKVYVNDNLCEAENASATGSCAATGNGTANSFSGDDALGGVQSFDYGECGCADDGGNLECVAEVEPHYSGENGAELVYVKPSYVEGSNACFACERIIVKDSSGRIVEETENCAEDLQIRLHQAPTYEGQQCEEYTLTALGTGEEEADAATCQQCAHSVCCPVCTTTQMLMTEVPSSDPDKPFDVTQVDSCADDCDFDVSFEDGEACGIVGQLVTLTVPEGSCVTKDDAYVVEDTVCDDDNDGEIQFTYSRGGIYDIALTCKDRTFSIEVPVSGDAVQTFIPDDTRCKKRISVRCAAGEAPADFDPDNNAFTFDGGDTPESDASGEDTEESEGPSCKPVNPKIYCRNCEGLGLPPE